MSESRWTPGPWELLTGDCRWIVSGGAGGVTVASIETLDADNEPRRHADADARLIAAAPELAEALREMIYGCGTVREADIVARARALLARLATEGGAR
jgi:hypothetical protein